MIVSEIMGARLDKSSRRLWDSFDSERSRFEKKCVDASVLFDINRFIPNVSKDFKSMNSQSRIYVLVNFAS